MPPCPESDGSCVAVRLTKMPVAIAARSERLPNIALSQPSAMKSSEEKNVPHPFNAVGSNCSW